MKKIVLSGFLLISLSGCAALEKMHQQWLVENCNVNAAYTNGLMDGLKSGAMPNNYGNSCPVSQAQISSAYLRGFSKGLEGRPQEINVTRNVVEQDRRHDYRNRDRKRNNHNVQQENTVRQPVPSPIVPRPTPLIPAHPVVPGPTKTTLIPVQSTVNESVTVSLDGSA
jgi:hypothetical protein